MSRHRRDDYPNARHHVTSRGNNGDVVFRSNHDRLAFLRILAKTTLDFQWIVHAYCLMDNHFHLLLETPEANLSLGMHVLKGTYTRNHNRLYDRRGHLFQGRFWSNPIEDTQHFLEVARYIALNPVRANLVGSPELFCWSSCPETAGWREEPTFLRTESLLSIFSEHAELARESYLRFIYQGIGEGDPAGDDGKQISRIQEVREIRWRAASKDICIERPSLNEMFSGVDSRSERNLRVRKAHLEYGYSLREIGEMLGVGTSTLSMMLKKLAVKN
jgi:putative transposase